MLQRELSFDRTLTGSEVPGTFSARVPAWFLGCPVLGVSCPGVAASGGAEHGRVLCTLLQRMDKYLMVLHSKAEEKIIEDGLPFCALL